MDTPIILEGICHQFYEPGLETLYWAFKEHKWRSVYPENVKWEHARLWILTDGDHLTIYKKVNPTQEIWSGFISLWTDRIDRIHQRDVSRRKWTRWFVKNYPAKFTPGPNQKSKPT